jgi:mono/diheme cytochrome c family protein
MQYLLQSFLTVFFITITVSACVNTEPNRYAQGAAIYKTACSDCHGDDGNGLKDLIPPLAKADFLQTNRSELACMLRKGMQDTIVVNQKKYAQIMPPQRLSAVEISNVLNYINHSWGNDSPDYVITDIKTQIKACADTRD